MRQPEVGSFRPMMLADGGNQRLRQAPFTGYLRQNQNSTSELHQWIRNNYIAIRDLELELILQR